MPPHEVAKRYAVTVEEDQVIALRLQHAEVPCSGSSEAAILLPGVLQPISDSPSQSLDDLSGLLGGTVIGDHDFERVDVLLVET